MCSCKGWETQTSSNYNRTKNLRKTQQKQLWSLFQSISSATELVMYSYSIDYYTQKSCTDKYRYKLQRNKDKKYNTETIQNNT